MGKKGMGLKPGWQTVTLVSKWVMPALASAGYFVYVSWLCKALHCRCLSICKIQQS